MKLKFFVILLCFFSLSTFCFGKESKENSFFLDKLYKNSGLKFLSSPEDADVELSFEEIVTRKGYPLSSYFVHTEDGYILKLYRIKGAKNSQNERKDQKDMKVVLLQHGLFDSADSWVANYEAKSPAFILANLGYDVWLGNNRGNKYSRNHISINPNDKKFWDFSFHEMGLYDIPAMIKFIQNKTASDSGEIKKITYIGHSQGSTQFFAGMTLLPDFYEKSFNGMVALGPVTNVEFVKSPLIRAMIDYHLDYLMDKIGITEVLPNMAALINFDQFVCKNVHVVCKFLLEAFADANTVDDDVARFQVFISHFPSGASYKSIKHYDQNIKTKSFATFGDMIPYDISRPKNIKIALMVGGEDQLATVKDNRIFKEVLEKNGLLNFYKEYELMGHMSFFVSKRNDFMVDLQEKVKEFSA